MYANHRSGFKHPSVPASASQVPHYDESDYVDQQYNGYADEPAPTQAPVHQQRRQGAATQAPQQESKAANGAQGKYPEYFSIKIHGSKAALNFIPDITRKNFLTISIEAAEMLNPANRTYNWGNKTRIQLTRTEYLEVVAVLLGMGETCKAKFDNHGVQGGPKKGFQLEHQGRHVFLGLNVFAVLQAQLQHIANRHGQGLRAVHTGVDLAHRHAGLVDLFGDFDRHGGLL